MDGNERGTSADVASGLTLRTLINSHADLYDLACKRRRLLAPSSEQLLATVTTFAEAQAQIAAREEEKRRAAARRDKYKQRTSTKSKSTPLAEPSLPGTVPGADVTTTAFWTFTEGYLRDITATDISKLVPDLDAIFQDPIFAYPAVQTRLPDESSATANCTTAKTKEIQLTSTPGQKPLPTETLSQASTVQDFLETDGHDKQRKSQRLHAKTAGHSLHSNRNDTVPTDAQPESGFDTFQPRTLMSPVQPSSLGPAQCHLQSADEHSIALLICQIMEFMRLDVEEVSTTCCIESSMLEAWLLAHQDSSWQQSQGDVHAQLHMLTQLQMWIAEAKATYVHPVLDPAQPPAAHILAEWTTGDVPGSWSVGRQWLKKGLASGFGTPNAQKGKVLHRHTKAMLDQQASASTSTDAGTKQVSGYADMEHEQNLSADVNGRTFMAAQDHHEIPKATETESAIAEAVQAYIANGSKEEGTEFLWHQMDQCIKAISMAPEDEIAAEILALQAELLQQLAINYNHAAQLLKSVLQDMPQQISMAEERAKGVEVARAWTSRQLFIKRSFKRERREAALRDAQKAAEAIVHASPRKIPGRTRSLAADSSNPNSRGYTPPPEVPLFDLLAERGAEDDALCAICAGGESSKTEANEIVFCERCDVAVHQKCYGVEIIPTGEWLCWPCKRFEEAELAAGRPQSHIRPPRWEQGTGKNGMPNKELTGGGRSVQCLLCPVQRGAFRQTTDCKHWVHQVCALWHPETSIRQLSTCATVEGCSDIKAERWGVECVICQRQEGAVCQCNAGQCSTKFHPLCARNNGQHLTIQHSNSSQPLARAYCALHSQAQREKDLGQITDREGPSGFIQKETRMRQHLDRATLTAMEAYELQLEERKLLTRIRLELESLRILMQRINRREKLKRDEIKASLDMHRGRLANPGWMPPPVLLATDEPGEAGVKRNAVRGRASRQEAPSIQVDREVMMTSGEAAATNDRLPKGFMYVPFSTLKGSK